MQGKKIKILLILSESPGNPSSGGAAAGYDRFRILSEIAEIALIYIDWNNEKADMSFLDVPIIALHPANRWGRIINKIRFFFSKKPWFFYLFSQTDLINCIRKMKKKINPDVICFDNIASTLFWNISDDCKRIYFAHNVESQIVEFVIDAGEGKNNKSKKIMFEYEKSIVRDANAVVFFTEKDKEALIPPHHNNLVDVVFPAFAPPLLLESNFVKGNYIIVPTNATWMPNKLSLEWFFSKVYPMVSSDVKFVITGRDGNDFISNLSKKFHNVEYMGLLDRDKYEDIFKKAKLCLNPTCYGSGFQIKMMEGIRFGIPIISTSFSNHIGDEIFSSDNPDVLAKKINSYMLYNDNISTVNYEELHLLTKMKLQKILKAMSLD